MRPPPQYQPNGEIRAMRTSLRIENTMGIGGEGARLRHAPRRGSTALGASRFVIFLSFRTLISGNPVRQYNCQTHDATTKEAESYFAPWNFQVVSDNE